MGCSFPWIRVELSITALAVWERNMPAVRHILMQISNVQEMQKRTHAKSQSLIPQALSYMPRIQKKHIKWSCLQYATLGLKKVLLSGLYINRLVHHKGVTPICQYQYPNSAHTEVALSSSTLKIYQNFMSWPEKKSFFVVRRTHGIGQQLLLMEEICSSC